MPISYRLAGFSTKKGKFSPFIELALSFPVSPGSKPPYVVSFYKPQSCVIKNFKDAMQKNRCVNAVWYPGLDPGMEKGH